MYIIKYDDHKSTSFDVLVTKQCIPYNVINLYI